MGAEVVERWYGQEVRIYDLDVVGSILHKKSTKFIQRKNKTIQDRLGPLTLYRSKKCIS